MTKTYDIKHDCRGMTNGEIIDVILTDRRIDDVDHFLHPTEDDLLPLDSLPNVHKAYELIDKHKDGNIHVLWDVDTDGITSGSIIHRYLAKHGIECVSHINEGKAHGLLNQDLTRFNDADLVIIVDSLDKDCSAYCKLKEQGKDIIVLDHHAVNPDVPYNEYVALVTSQVGYNNPALSGAGCVWKFCKYIDDQELTDYADELVDLAACGLVSDMMDMTVMENRYIVSRGLEKINNLALKKIIGSYEFNTTAISFSIAPLINSANRMFKNQVAMQAFLSDNEKEVLNYIKELRKTREEQNKEVERLMPSVIEQCEAQIDNKMIITYIDTLYGIGGLLANKLLEKYQRPILVLKDCKDRYSGSMRAAGLDDFRKMIIDSGLATSEGHELAAGVDIPKENVIKFAAYIEEALSNIKTTTSIHADIQIDVDDITRGLIEQIKALDKISGTGFEPIKIYVNGITSYDVSNFSNYKHLVIKPKDYLLLIKWNWNGSFDEMEDNSIVAEELEIVATLDSGWLGRSFVLKAICDEINVRGDWI